MKRKFWCMLLCLFCILPSLILFGGCDEDKPRSIANAVLMPDRVTIYWDEEKTGTYNDGEKNYEWSFTSAEIAEILYNNGLLDYLGQEEVEYTLEEKKEILRSTYTTEFLVHYPEIFVASEEERCIILGGYDKDGNPYNQKYKLKNVGEEGFNDLYIYTLDNDFVGSLVASSKKGSLSAVFVLIDNAGNLNLPCVKYMDFDIPEDCEAEIELTAQDGTKKNVKLVDVFRTDDGPKVMFKIAMHYIQVL